MTAEYIYEPLDGILVRTPLMPTAFGSSDGLPERNQTLQLTAIAVSSTSLAERLKKAPSTPKILSAQRRYQKRMSHRATPYGLLAGVSWATFGEHTTLSRSEGEIVTQTRPDMEWLLTIVTELERDIEVRPYLSLFTNPEALVIGGNVWLERFVFPKYLGSKETISMSASRVVLHALHLCKEGKITFTGLCERLFSEFGGSLEDATQLCEHLLESKLLLSDLRFALNDWPSLLSKLSILKFSKLAMDTYQQLELALSQIEDWDKLETKTAETFLSLTENLRRAAPKGLKDVVQVDAKFGLEGDQISRRVSMELTKALEVVLRMGSNQFDSTISSYLELFEAKYQAGRQISLLELLSPRFGLGSPYTRAVALNSGMSSKRDEALIRLVAKALASGCNNIELTDKDVTDLEMWTPTLKDAPLSVELHAGIVASSRSAIDKGDFEILLMPYTGAIGAGRTQGRFAGLLGNQAIEHLAQIDQLENDESETLKVDVSFWPETPRSSNVAVAPTARQYCINVNCSAPPGAIAIPVSEISIGVAERRFYAVWMRTGQRIMAISSSLLTYSAVPDSLRFLLDIATYGQPKPVGIHCGYASELIFCPRITYGKVILRTATWNLRELKALVNSKMDPTEFSELFCGWKKQWRVPRQVSLSSAGWDDNLIYLDLDAHTDLELLREILSKEESSEPVLHEYIPFDSWNSNAIGSYATEIVVGFVRKSHHMTEIQGSELKTIRTQEILAVSDYLKPPGTEWLYLQLECSNQLQEYVTVQLSQLADRLTEHKAIDRWFFVRYRDPEPQLRVRFRVSPDSLYTTLIPELFGWASGLVSKRVIKAFSVTTYDREIERYGGKHGMDLAEKLFALDSSLTARIFAIPTLRKLDRSIVAAITMRWSLNAMAFNDVEQLELLDYVRTTKSSLADSDYRLLKNLLYCAMNDSFHQESSYRPVISLVESFASEYAEIANEFRTLRIEGRLSKSLEEIYRSLIHMHCIRLLGVNREMELKALTLYHMSLRSFLKRREHEKIKNTITA